MTKINYYVNGTMVEIEVEDDFASKYNELDHESKKAAERHRWHKRKHLLRLDVIDEDAEILEDGSEDIEEKVIKNEEYAALHKALKTLLPQQQDIIKKIYFEGKSKIEVARELGITDAAVRNRLRKIFEKIKKVF